MSGGVCENLTPSLRGVSVCVREIALIRLIDYLFFYLL